MLGRSPYQVRTHRVTGAIEVWEVGTWVPLPRTPLVTRLSPPEIVAGIQNLALALDSARNLQATFVNQIR